MDRAGVQLGKVLANARTVRGLVVNTLDPLMQGRVQVQIPSMGVTAWAPVESAAGGGRGGTFAPAVGDEVLVAFQGGDLRYPVVTGGLWNGGDKPPTSNNNVGVQRNVKIGVRGKTR